MAASRERAAPVFIGLPFGSAAVFVAAVACGRSHPAVALLLLEPGATTVNDRRPPAAAGQTHPGQTGSRWRGAPARPIRE